MMFDRSWRIIGGRRREQSLFDRELADKLRDVVEIRQMGKDETESVLENADYGIYQYGRMAPEEDEVVIWRTGPSRSTRGRHQENGRFGPGQGAVARVYLIYAWHLGSGSGCDRR